MTIEIKQLVIRAIVDAGRERQPAAASSAGFPLPGVSMPVQPTIHPAALDEQREAIVAACVREVLRKLERSRDR